MTKSAEPKPSTHLVPVKRAGRSGGGNARFGGYGSWRPSAQFLAQMISENGRDNRLLRARRDAVSILDAYGEASTLADRPTQTLYSSV